MVRGRGMVAERGIGQEVGWEYVEWMKISV